MSHGGTAIVTCRCDSAARASSCTTSLQIRIQAEHPGLKTIRADVAVKVQALSPAAPSARPAPPHLRLSQADRDSLVATVVAKYPGFNVLINNAGIQKKAPAPCLPSSSFSLSTKLPLAHVSSCEDQNRGRIRHGGNDRQLRSARASVPLGHSAYPGQSQRYHVSSRAAYCHATSFCRGFIMLTDLTSHPALPSCLCPLRQFTAPRKVLTCTRASECVLLTSHDNQKQIMPTRANSNLCSCRSCDALLHHLSPPANG